MSRLGPSPQHVLVLTDDGQGSTRRYSVHGLLDEGLLSTITIDEPIGPGTKVLVGADQETSSHDPEQRSGTVVSCSSVGERRYQIALAWDALPSHADRGGRLNQPRPRGKAA